MINQLKIDITHLSCVLEQLNSLLYFEQKGHDFNTHKIVQAKEHHKNCGDSLTN